jgi:hypothetical protein
MNIELNEQEANVLLQLLDEAVKAKGLIYAEPAVFFRKKIEEAARNSTQTPSLQVVK